ncbi:DUF4407 domain-containing protein [Flavobacterium sp. LC2016-01]|uniref:DUF4407 domain-containing protein n=1 Tax=Flavobacterium sp. LC2016-01 TaxID=2675876 RepID=UPI0012BA76C7|nr:DUF4407 domain-containing protein [Flavobacterium sp. LC2016-01]MTH15664.1 DUF4407 domain-containing protein [Flavobacterium sp. LC2016-01]
MNKAVNEIRLFLFTCSGEDNYILKRCNANIQTRFALIGFFVLLIFTGCFFSATFFIISLFDGAKWVSLPMGIIWGAVIVNMYLLLLHTISPAIIPLSSKRKKNKYSNDNSDLNQNSNKFLTLSMNLRIGFMMLLAVIIAQPLNVFMFSSSIKSNIEKHKISERIKLYSLTNKQLIKEELTNQKEFNDKITTRLNLAETRLITSHLNIIKSKIATDSLFVINATKKLTEFNKIDEKFSLNDKEEEKKAKILNELESLLNNELISDENFITNINSIAIQGSLKKDFDDFKTNLTILVNDKIKNYNSLNILLNKSNFYIKTIQILFAESLFSWLLTLSVCAIFLLPIYFKYKVRSVCSLVFKTKEKNEAEIIKLREELINTTNFRWLENKIKSINISNIRTSDYYFQRMLIEHKIILEEYDHTKKVFKKNLTIKISLFNKASLERLNPLLEKLKQYNVQKYNEISGSIFKEYVDEEMIKYEYWLDCPFRTKMRAITKISNDEKGLLDFLYNQNTEINN